MSIEDFTVKVNGNETPWRLFEPKDHKQEWAVLWLQGFTSTIEGHSEGVVRMAESADTTFAMLNYAGHGNNPIQLDDASRSQQFAEVCAVYDQLLARGYTKIIASGGSFGAYMAALLAGNRELQSIVLRAPAIYEDAEFELPFAQTRGKSDKGYKIDPWRSSVSDETPSIALDNVRNFTGNTFVFEHEFDEVVSQNVPKAYSAVARHSNYIVIRDCKHSPKLMENPEHYYQIIEKWLETVIVTTQFDGQITN